MATSPAPSLGRTNAAREPIEQIEEAENAPDKEQEPEGSEDDVHSLTGYHMMTVIATREGIQDGLTASGYRIDRFVPFVALPSTAALRLWVLVVNPANGRSMRALVLDVGPWNTHDNAYVFGGQRPQAETGIDTRGRRTNKSGIDLGEVVWKGLGMTDNTEIEWSFV